MFDAIAQIVAEFWTGQGNGSVADKVTAVATVAIAVLTGFLGWYARGQIRSSRIQNREWKTLDICGEYERNPTIEGAARRIYEAKRFGVLTAESHARDAIIILNYLESIAIGIEQKLYSDPLARQHLQPIVSAHVMSFCNEQDDLGIGLGNFERVIALNKRWSGLGFLARFRSLFRRFPGWNGRLLPENLIVFGRIGGLDELSILLPIIGAFFLFMPAFTIGESSGLCYSPRLHEMIERIVTCRTLDPTPWGLRLQVILLQIAIAGTSWLIIFSAIWRFETINNGLGVFTSFIALVGIGLAISQMLATIYMGEQAPDWRFHILIFYVTALLAAGLSLGAAIGLACRKEDSLCANVVVGFKVLVYLVYLSAGVWWVFQGIH